jgi:hypothetical protein
VGAGAAGLATLPFTGASSLVFAVIAASLVVLGFLALTVAARAGKSRN